MRIAFTVACWALLTSATFAGTVSVPPLGYIGPLPVGPVPDDAWPPVPIGSWDSESTSNFFSDIGFCCFIAGDMNLDGAIDLIDVPVFAHALISPQDYRRTYGINAHVSGDLDDDGDMDVDDIDDFAMLLSSEGFPGVAEMIHRHLRGVPEPSSLVLLLSASGTTLVGRTRRST